VCGIVGALVFDNNTFSISEEYLVRMRDSMVHRGPDGGGFWISDDRRVGLGHRRLSIIDLSDAASQPMCNEDGSIWISYNGEIYNHLQIRRDLERSGSHRWKTDHSDTEVIIHAFEHWGIDCLERFRGMFAFALWDERKGEFWLVRDRIGIKPLYYSVHHGRLVFASEIKALLHDPDQKRALHEEALFHYLSFLTTPPPQTLFDSIKKLTAGNWLKITRDGSIRVERYWDVWDHTTPLASVSEEEIADRILAELRASVQLRKVSDVPVGVFLSGGIDSSTNTALFSEGEITPVKTFSIGYKGDYKSYKNELHYARKVADLMGAQYHERILTIDDFLDFLPDMIRLQDEPIADPVCMPLYFVSKLAKENGVTVCQVGEGADELFWGYPGWKWVIQIEKFNRSSVPLWMKNLILGVMRWWRSENSQFYTWLYRGATGSPSFWGGAESFYEPHKYRLLSPKLKEKFANYSSWEVLKDVRSRFERKAWEKSDLHWMTYLDLSIRLPELLLMRVDKMSMGVSLEGRVPFLDHKLVELVMSIPSSVKTTNGTLKSILKKSVRGVIPDEIIERKKQGFAVPLREWFFDRLGEKAWQVLPAFCDQADLLDKKTITELLDQGRGAQVWFLLNLALWWNENIG
jgi:asparagine synthase (glutamine-hydrolysing)